MSGRHAMPRPNEPTITVGQPAPALNMDGIASSHPSDDLDLMAVVVEAPRFALGLDRLEFERKQTWITRSKPEGVRSEAGDVDHVAHSLRKYLVLALKNNPSVLLPLFAPESAIQTITDDGIALRALAPDIVSQYCHSTFKGYMLEQLARLQGIRGQRNITRPELIEKYGFDTKYAGHIVRLGLQGREILSTGRLSLPMREDDRNLVLDIRTGRYSLDEIGKISSDLMKSLDLALCSSPLPSKPNYAKVEEWMIDVYLRHWGYACDNEPRYHLRQYGDVSRAEMEYYNVHRTLDGFKREKRP